LQVEELAEEETEWEEERGTDRRASVWWRKWKGTDARRSGR